MSLALSLTGGALLGLGFVVPVLWPLCFLGAAVLIEGIRKAASFRQAFVSGLLGGCVLYGFAYGPVFWNTLPLDWLGAFPRLSQIFFIGLSWSLVVVGVACSVGLFALVLRALFSERRRDIPLAAAAWVVCEYVGAFLFSIESMGRGSLIGTHFSLGFVGNLLASDTVLLQAAWLGGVSLLSALVFAGGGFFVHLLHGDRRERRIGIAVAGVLILVWGGGYLVLSHVTAERGASVRVALVGMQELPVLAPTKEDNQRHLDTLLHTLEGIEAADVVVFPENADFLSLVRAEDGPGPDVLLKKIFQEPRPVLIDSQTTYTGAGLGAELEYYDVESAQSQYSFKRFLLPDGEYVPYLFRWFAEMLGYGAALDSVAAHRTFIAGMPAVAQVRGTSFGGLFCDETMSPYLYANLARDGAEVFINTASHSWFHGSRVVAEQLLRAAKIRAVESRRWYAQASDAVPSYVLDPYGRIVAESGWGKAEVLQATVYARDDETPYLQFGNGTLGCALVVLGILALLRKKRAILQA